MHQRNLGAKALQDAGEFHRDIAGTKHRHALRQRLQGEDVIRNQAKLSTGNIKSRGHAAHRDNDALSRHALAADIKRMRIQECCPRIEGSDPGIAQQAAINARKPRDFGIPCRRQLRPIMPVIFKRPPKGRRIFRPGAIFGGIHHDLLRHAADIHTSAAPEAFFGNTNPRPMTGGNTRGAHPTRTATNHEKIKIISHGNTSVVAFRMGVSGQQRAR